jgi:hypothetical protein
VHYLMRAGERAAALFAHHEAAAYYERALQLLPPEAGADDQRCVILERLGDAVYAQGRSIGPSLTGRPRWPPSTSPGIHGGLPICIASWAAPAGTPGGRRRPLPTWIAALRGWEQTATIGGAATSSCGSRKGWGARSAGNT